jgi:hypothetical protein
MLSAIESAASIPEALPYATRWGIVSGADMGTYEATCAITLSGLLRAKNARKKEA